ncbi:MAG: hemerythrin domain-containing protein [Myxococcota bacterium]
MTKALSTREVWLVRNGMLADHRELEALFQRLLDAFAANAREDTQALWTELQHRLISHLEAEEQLLFPHFAAVNPAEVEALKEEHRQLRRQLDELGVGVDLKLVRAEVAKAFIEALEAHACREDALLYQWADEAADAATRRTLAQRFTSLG